MAEQPVVKVQLHSTGAASRLPTLLLGQILPVGAEGHGQWLIISKQRSGYREGAAEGSARTAYRCASWQGARIRLQEVLTATPALNALPVSGRVGPARRDTPTRTSTSA